VTHLQIAYVPAKFLIKWGLVTSRSTMDKIFLSIGQHLLHWQLHSFRIQLIKDHMKGFMSYDAAVPNRTRQLCGLGRLSNAPLFSWYLLGWIPFPTVLVRNCFQVIKTQGLVFTYNLQLLGQATPGLVGNAEYISS
jgi:hypothetical protein